MAAAPPGLDWLVNGSGVPVTVFLPGLGGAISHLRPLAGGIPGTRVFLELAAETVADDYAGLASLFGTAADACGADRALGVSLGAGVLLRLLSQSPDRFRRVVLFQPSALDFAAPERLADLEHLAALGEAGELERLAELLNAELPLEIRDLRPSRESSMTRAQRLARPEGLRLLKNLASGEPPVADPTTLAKVTAEVLVISGTDDHVHPQPVAEQIAAALPRSELVVIDHPAPLWHARLELRQLIAGFLGGQSVAGAALGGLGPRRGG